jgi:hypothetical protein
MGLEGILAKRRDSRHHSGRSRDWIKIKNMAHPAIERAMPRASVLPLEEQPNHSSAINRAASGNGGRSNTTFGAVSVNRSACFANSENWFESRIMAAFAKGSFILNASMRLSRARARQSWGSEDMEAIQKWTGRIRKGACPSSHVIAKYTLVGSPCLRCNAQLSRKPGHLRPRGNFCKRRMSGSWNRATR